MPPPEHRPPSVHTVPRIVVADAAAQALDARMTACGHLLDRKGVEAFWHPARRDLVMHLPTNSGQAVLSILEQAAKCVKFTMPEEQRAQQLEKTLIDAVKKRWYIDCRRLWYAVAPSEPFPHLMIKFMSCEETSSWYKATYESQAARDSEIARHSADGKRFPGREFRAGRAEGKERLYPDPGSEELRVKRPSGRANVGSEVRPGEKVPHPGDTERFWPGVSASHRCNNTPPTLSSDMERGGGYCWVPLARRVDLDRVLNTLLEHPKIFKDVTCTTYKSEPWTHMNPYEIQTTIRLKQVAGSQTDFPHSEYKLNG